MNASRPQSSMLLNVNDPIQVHLLVETALGDSQEFELLSPEEVDDLKKQCQSITQRIEQTRQNLAIQSKYRDAAVSMAKLYNPSDRRERNNSRSGTMHHKSDSIKQADLERLQSEKKCEDLAAELWSLEKRLMEPQSRLLKHTAGILQMTHKGPKNMPKGSGPQQSGMPGSPESIYTYHNARISLEPITDEILFDERSFYRAADRLDAYGGDLDGRDSYGPPPKSQARDQMQLISKTEQTLEDLNTRLRDVIIKANPQRQNSYSLPPLAKTTPEGRAADPGETLQSHLDYLEKSIQAIDQEHSQSAKYQLESERAMEERIEELNHEVRALLLPYVPDRPEPPQLTGRGLDQQLLYFQDSIGAIETELANAGNKKAATDNPGQMETVVTGLWDIIQSGEQDMKRKRGERRMARSANGLPEDEDDSPDEGDDPNEPFSLQAFSTKVQWLYSQATRLKEQKKVLQRQIKQQRELNSKSDATKDAEIVQRIEELERTKALLVRAETDANNVRQQLSVVMEKLDQAQQQERLRDQERSGSDSEAVRAAQAEIEMREQTISRLEDELQELKDDHNISNAEIQTRISESESRIAVLTTELSAAAAAQATAENVVKQKEEELAAKEREVDSLSLDLARLQTEVTIARAELDGAYGSRAERAAEVAANPAIQKEIDDLMKKNASLTAEIAQLTASIAAVGQGSQDSEAQLRTLKKELEETITEYELMTKASIEWEKDREKLEETIDKLRDEKESLQTQLSDENVRWLGMKNQGGESSGPGSTSTTVLKNEFKKMMRDTRAENARALRVCFLFLPYLLPILKWRC
jgi:DNA repair exonuclease SbcCD ATPase subunit